ncbi:heat shock protein 21, chloroplastic-like [Vicia villosa]|uniref:heat shock protein 21, chloroplastic-like n=1 Tax=Vicia villosa TaxID=3911 RepID=UPI00273AA15A|nr:heat shock protein 21, chloroplastic-like [Vicia villosa]
MHGSRNVWKLEYYTTSGPTSWCCRLSNPYHTFQNSPSLVSKFVYISQTKHSYFIKKTSTNTLHLSSLDKKMSQTLSSNIGLNYQAIISKTSLKPTHFPSLQKLKPLRAMTEDAREKLDHVPISNHQPQLKKRLVPFPSIPTWDRFPTARTVQEMLETMERMMEDPFAMSTIEWPSSPLPSEGVGGYRRRGRAPWEIKEGEEEYKLRFDMPGMNKEDVKVWVEEKMVVVKAEKGSNKKKNEEDEEWGSNSYGRYSGRIALPENVKFEDIKAEVKDGVLYITIPKVVSYSKVMDISVQ